MCFYSNNCSDLTIVQCFFDFFIPLSCKTPTFESFFAPKIAQTSIWCNVFLTFSYPSHVKHLLLRAFLEDCLPERLSKVGVLAERGIKKSKKHHAIAPISKNLCFYSVFGRFCLKCCVLQCFERIFAQQLLRRPSEAVDVWVSSGGALGGPGRALGGSIYRKTPDQPPQRPLC